MSIFFSNNNVTLVSLNISNKTFKGKPNRRRKLAWERRKMCKYAKTLCLRFVPFLSIRPVVYHWRELRQLSFFCRAEGSSFFGSGKHTFVATKDVFCRDKYVFVRQNWYLWQLPPMIVCSLVWHDYGLWKHFLPLIEPGCDCCKYYCRKCFRLPARRNISLDKARTLIWLLSCFEVGCAMLWGAQTNSKNRFTTLLHPLP